MNNSRYIPVEIEKLSGGMGEVSFHKDIHLDRLVVIKRLKSGGDQRRILDEQKALLKLRSKHVVQLFDIIDISDHASGEKGLVLERLSGHDLKMGTYTPGNDYLKVLWQIASGLSDIHSSGIIHRDIKPNNIRLDDEGVIKIIDFGLARSDEYAETKNIVGTPVFMAPELWGNNTIKFDSSIDVYAFGVTCLALITNKLPDELNRFPRKPVDHATVASILSGISPDVVDIVHQCLSPLPNNRPQMKVIAGKISRHLLYNKHRALIVMGNQAYELNNTKRSINLNAGAAGTLSIIYDGYDFVVRSVSGDVTFNNNSASIGDVVPGCCVITFSSGKNRVFVTFDVSNPEVLA